MSQFYEFIVNHWTLWLAFIVILTFIVINELIAQKKSAKQLSPQAVVERINNEEVKIFDVRDKDSYKNGHIIGAVHANADDFLHEKMDKYKAQAFILVCARGLQTPTLANKLKSKGFKEPLVLAGGMTSWLGANLPTVKARKKSQAKLKAVKA